MQAGLQDFSLAEEKGFWLQVRLGKPGEAVKSWKLLAGRLGGEDILMHCRGPGSKALGCSTFCQGCVCFCPYNPIQDEQVQASQDMREAVLRIQDSCLSKYPLSDTQVCPCPYLL